MKGALPLNLEANEIRGPVPKMHSRTHWRLESAGFVGGKHKDFSKSVSRAFSMSRACLVLGGPLQWVFSLRVPLNDHPVRSRTNSKPVARRTFVRPRGRAAHGHHQGGVHDSQRLEDHPQGAPSESMDWWMSDMGALSFWELRASFFLVVLNTATKRENRHAILGTPKQTGKV